MSNRPLTVLVASLLVAAAAPTARAALVVRPPGAPGPLATETLSDEHTVTRFAYSVEIVKIHSQPSTATRSVGRMHLYMSDNRRQSYLVLASQVVGSTVWLQIRVPGRPNGRVGWVKREALGKLIVVRTALRVNRHTLRATLYRDGHPIWTSPVGVGKASTPTPAGHFWVTERVRGLGPAYGPVSFGTSAFSVLSEWPGGGVVGIHGTNAPGLIPGRPSHGCIRLPNYKVTSLARHIEVGTPVDII